MALNFSKMNFSVSINPLSAFPLDARSYFESYDAAVIAAQKAVEAGSTEGIHYFGQTICVVENNVASMYIIQPDGTLGEVGGKIEIDEKQFALENGSLSLLGFANAVEGAQPVKTADGSIEWRKPDNSVVEGIQEAIGVPSSEGVEATGIYAELEKKANAENVYSKNEADQAIASAIANVSHLKREIFADLDAAEAAMESYGDSAGEYIYMVAKAKEEDGNHYDEYMAFKLSEESSVWLLEKVGDWGVDLSAYAKTEDVNNALNLKANTADVESALSLKSSVTDVTNWLNNKVDKIDGHSLMSEAEHSKLEGIEAGAQKNFIKTVDTAQFNVDASGNLTLLDIAQSKVTGLADVLNGKVDKIDGHRLITAEEAKKLEALSIDEDGSVGISGTVNASRVQELYNAVVNIVTGEGTSEYDGEQKTLLNIEAGAQVNVINSVNTEELTIDENKQLSIKSIVASKVTDLTSLLNAKADKVDVEALEERIGIVEGMLTWVEMTG